MEIWKPVIGFEEGYEVSDLGNVRSISRYVDSGKRRRKISGKILKQCLDGGGYLKVIINLKGEQRQVNVHVLVAESFLTKYKNKQRLVIDHINKIKTDNRVCNLRYITNRKNISINRNTKRPYVGVSKSSVNRWKAEIQIDGIKMYLGVFKTPEEASYWYEKTLDDYINCR